MCLENAISVDKQMLFELHLVRVTFPCIPKYRAKEFGKATSFFAVYLFRANFDFRNPINEQTVKEPYGLVQLYIYIYSNTSSG